MHAMPFHNLRTAAVLCVGFATLAAFIGAGGLGEPIVTGLYLNDVRLILAGAVPAALLALAADKGLAADFIELFFEVTGASVSFSQLKS